MNTTNRLLVTNELEEFEKQLAEVQDFKRIIVILEESMEYSPL
jgi:hypothetical protein